MDMYCNLKVNLKIVEFFLFFFVLFLDILGCMLFGGLI